MKKLREKGNCLIRSTILPFFTAMLFIFPIFLFGNNITEARADIGYQITNISLQTGKCVIYGCFYNDGDSGATVTKIKFLGEIRDLNDRLMYAVDQTWEDIDVGFLSAGEKRSWSFTSYKNIYLI